MVDYQEILLSLWGGEVFSGFGVCGLGLVSGCFWFFGFGSGSVCVAVWVICWGFVGFFMGRSKVGRRALADHLAGIRMF